MNKQQAYDNLLKTLDSLCEGENDPIALMATISCEIFHHFDAFHWVGFYRNMGDELLKIGPYQGGHGCLRIPFHRGVCGQAAREQRLINVADVNAHSDHIACSSTTQSEIVVPIMVKGQLLAVLDIDSDAPAMFDDIDEAALRQINRYFETD